jgi:hypothetical protein
VVLQKLKASLPKFFLILLIPIKINIAMSRVYNSCSLYTHMHITLLLLYTSPKSDYYLVIRLCHTLKFSLDRTFAN